jgi:hypothetical protein
MRAGSSPHRRHSLINIYSLSSFFFSFLHPLFTLFALFLFRRPSLSSHLCYYPQSIYSDSHLPPFLFPSVLFLTLLLQPTFTPLSSNRLSNEATRLTPGETRPGHSTSLPSSLSRQLHPSDPLRHLDHPLRHHHHHRICTNSSVNMLHVLCQSRRENTLHSRRIHNSRDKTNTSEPIRRLGSDSAVMVDL